MDTTLPATERVAELDQLGLVFPLARSDRLAELLTDDDVATLKHLFAKGHGENSIRALASDTAYWEAWAVAATGAPLPWPTPKALLLKFVVHHLWDAEARAVDASHGMPASVAEALAGGWPRSPPCITGAGWPAPPPIRRSSRR